jgi:hypothetical protein
VRIHFSAPVASQAPARLSECAERPRAWALTSDHLHGCKSWLFHYLCGLEQVTKPLSVSVSSFVKMKNLKNSENYDVDYTKMYLSA